MSDEQSDQAGETEQPSSRPVAPGKGESDGGAYPNPHTGKDGAEPIDTFSGHGGQSEQDYHGPGQLGTKARTRSRAEDQPPSVRSCWPNQSSAAAKWLGSKSGQSASQTKKSA